MLSHSVRPHESRLLPAITMLALLWAPGCGSDDSGDQAATNQSDSSAPPATMASPSDGAPGGMPGAAGASSGSGQNMAGGMSSGGPPGMPGMGAPDDFSEGESMAGMSGGMGMPGGMSGAPGMSGGMGMPGGMSGAPGMSGGMGMPGGMSGAPGMSGGMGIPGGMSGAPGMSGGMGMPGMPGMPGMGGPGGMNGASPAPSLAADVTTWSDEDMKTAATFGDPRLLAAINHRVESAPGDVNLPGLLLELLQAARERPVTAAGNQPGGFPGSFGGEDFSEFGEGYGEDSGLGEMPGGLPGAPGGIPGAPGGIPGAPGSYPGSSGGRQMPGTMKGPGSSSSLQGAPGSGGVPSSGGGVPSSGGPGTLAPPQSRNSIPPFRTIDAMLAESMTAWQSAAGVGAMRGRFQPPSGQLGSGPPGMLPPGGEPLGGGEGGLQMPGGLSGEYGSEPSYPGMGGMPGMDGMGGMPGMGGAAGQNRGGPGGLDDRKLVEAVLEGLIQNGSPAAWQAIFSIFSGQSSTPLELAEATEIGTYALFRNLESDPIQIPQVLLAITNGSAPLPTESRDAAISAIAVVSGQALAKITGYSPTMAVVANTAGGFGMGGEFGEGYGEEGGFGGMPGMPGAPGMGSGMPGMPGAPGMGSGMPGGMSGATAGAWSAPALTDTVLTKSREFLWSDQFAAAVAGQLTSATDLTLALPFLKLAAAMPCKATRSAVYTLFSGAHATGADALNAQSYFTSSVYDPGMLVSLKSLPRPSRTRADDDATPMDSWTGASRQLVRSLAGQLRNMSLSPGGKLKPDVKGFPVRAHRGAEFDFVGQMNLGGSTDGVAITRISYARLNFSPKREKDQETVLKHYESSSAGIKYADAASQLLWLDGVKTTTTGIRRSIDVLIQPGTVGGAAGNGGGPPGFGGGEMPGAGMGGGAGFVIEVMVVESEDPGT